MTRQDKLRRIADLHAAWVAEHLDAAGEAFDPSGRKPDSDYNLHHVDLDASGEAQDEFVAAAMRILEGEADG